MGPIQTPKKNGRSTKNTPEKTPKSSLKTPQSGNILKQKDRESMSKSTPKMAEGLKPQKTPGSLQKSFKDSPNKTEKRTPNPQGKSKTLFKHKTEEEDEEMENSDDEEENGVETHAPTPKMKIEKAKDEEEEEEDEEDDDDDEEEDDEEEGVEKRAPTPKKMKTGQAEVEDKNGDAAEELEEEDDGEEDPVETVTPKKRMIKEKEAETDEEENDDSDDDKEKTGEEKRGEKVVKEMQRLRISDVREMEGKGTPVVVAYNYPPSVLDSVVDDIETLGLFPYFDRKSKLFLKDEESKKKLLMTQGKYRKRDSWYMTTQPPHEVYALGIPTSSDLRVVYESLDGALTEEGVYHVYIPMWRGRTVGYAVFLTVDETTKEALLKKKTIDISGCQYELYSEETYKEKFVLKYANMPRHRTCDQSMFEKFKEKVASIDSEILAITRNYMYFDKAESATKVLQLNGQEFGGRKIVLKRPSESLYMMVMKNLSPFVIEDDITGFLKKKGIEAQFVCLWGFLHSAFVGVLSEEEQKMLLALHQTEMEGDRISVVYFNEKEKDLWMRRSQRGGDGSGGFSPGRGAFQGARGGRGGGFHSNSGGRGFGGQGHSFRGGSRGSGDNKTKNTT